MLSTPCCFLSQSLTRHKVQASEVRHNGRKAPSVGAVPRERMRPVGDVLFLWIPFRALLIGWREGHLPHKKMCASYPQRFSFEKPRWNQLSHVGQIKRRRWTLRPVSCKTCRNYSNQWPQQQNGVWFEFFLQEMHLDTTRSDQRQLACDRVVACTSYLQDDSETHFARNSQEMYMVEKIVASPVTFVANMTRNAMVISCSSKIQNGLPFRCQLIQVVMEKRSLNWCSSNSSSHSCMACSAEFLIVLSLTDCGDGSVQTATSRMRLICSSECSSRRTASWTSGSWLLTSTCITEPHSVEARTAVEGIWLNTTYLWHRFEVWVCDGAPFCFLSSDFLHQ